MVGIVGKVAIFLINVRFLCFTSANFEVSRVDPSRRLSNSFSFGSGPDISFSMPSGAGDGQSDPDSNSFSYPPNEPTLDTSFSFPNPDTSMSYNHYTAPQSNTNYLQNDGSSGAAARATNVVVMGTLVCAVVTLGS